MGSRSLGGPSSGENEWVRREDELTLHRLRSSRTMPAVRPEQAVAVEPAHTQAAESPQTGSGEVDRRRLPILRRILKLLGVKVEK